MCPTITITLTTMKIKMKLCWWYIKSIFIHSKSNSETKLFFKVICNAIEILLRNSVMHSFKLYLRDGGKFVPRSLLSSYECSLFNQTKCDTKHSWALTRTHECKWMIHGKMGTIVDHREHNNKPDKVNIKINGVKI